MTIDAKARVEAGDLTLVIPRNRLVWSLSATAGLLLVAHLLTSLNRYVFGLTFFGANDLYVLFDMWDEVSIPSWYSVTLLLLASGVLTILAAGTVALIRREVENLDRELKAMNADDVTHHLIRAIYYERRSLYEDAFREYRETIRLAPDVEEYRDMMRNLLVTLRLYGEEDYLLR